MTLCSSTSSSSGLLEPPMVGTGATLPTKHRVRQLATPARPSLADTARGWPLGGLTACLTIALTHAVVSSWIVPHPIAREELRQKVLAMTAETRPALIVAGDSRAWWHIDPAVVAQGIDRPRECIVNIAVNSCDSSAVLAAYREFSDRFAPSPIMAISISPYAVNDGVDMDRWVHDEMLWSISPVDRFRLASFKDAVQATFLPERELANRVARMYIRPEPYVPPHEGYWAIGQTAPLDWESDRVRERIRFINEVWLKDALINGIRWRQFAKDLLSLREAGTQVVLLDSPEHPRLAEELHGTAAAASIAAFHRQLNDLGRQMGIPILRGTDPLNDGYWHGAADPDALYCDPVHMNRVGAGLFSKAVGREIRALVDSGMLHLPQNPPGSH